MDQLAALFRRLFPFISGEEFFSVFRTDYLKYLKMYWSFFIAAILLSTHPPFNLLKRLLLCCASDTGHTVSRKVKTLSIIALSLILAAIFFGSFYCMYRIVCTADLTIRFVL